MKFVTVTCPSCSEKNTFGDDSFVDQGTRPCEHCGTYLWEDAGRVVAVPSGTIHPKPVFAAPLVLPLEVHDCVVCGAQADFKIQIEGTTKKIGVATNTYVTRELELPVCGAHQDNENAALVGGGIAAEGLDGFALRLRNFDLAERLRGR